jgi:hypothetical protein
MTIRTAAGLTAFFRLAGTSVGPCSSFRNKYLTICSLSLIENRFFAATARGRRSSRHLKYLMTLPSALIENNHYGDRADLPGARYRW